MSHYHNRAFKYFEIAIGQPWCSIVKFFIFSFLFIQWQDFRPNILAGDLPLRHGIIRRQAGLSGHKRRIETQGGGIEVGRQESPPSGGGPGGKQWRQRDVCGGQGKSLWGNRLSEHADPAGGYNKREPAAYGDRRAEQRYGCGRYPGAIAGAKAYFRRKSDHGHFAIQGRGWLPSPERGEVGAGAAELYFCHPAWHYALAGTL